MNAPARQILWRTFSYGVVITLVGAIALTQVTHADNPASAAVLLCAVATGIGGVMVTFALTGWAAMLGFRAAQEEPTTWVRETSADPWRTETGPDDRGAVV